MPEQTCKRPGCHKTLPKGRHKYCGEACAKFMQDQQLASISVKRKEARRNKPPVKCAIPTCTGTLVPTCSSHKYCSTECSLAGLQLAIERQKARRQEEKRLRGLTKKESKVEAKVS